MSTTTPEGTSAATAGTSTPPAGTPAGTPTGTTADDTLGEGGKKALQSERDARKALEKQLSDFQAAQKAQADKLAEAFGIKQAKDATSDDLVTALQQQVQDMRHESLVYRVATEHQITDADDLELIKGVSDEQAMRKLAARLAKKAEEPAGTPPGRRLPLPDPSQGRGGDGRLPAGGDGLAEAQRRFGPRKQ